MGSLRTHWHDDHIRGLSTIVDASPQAEFACSSALHSKEFFALVESAESRLLQAGSGADEFHALVQIAQRRRRPGMRNQAAFPTHWAGSNMRLLSTTGGVRAFPAEVWSLSPSAGTRSLATIDFVNALEPGPRRRLVSSSNELSVVLWVQVAETALLLGADLEDRGRPGEGWTAVVASGAPFPTQAKLFKVPHHGSPNADLPAVWSNLLAERPVAALTPFLAGPQGRPSEEDLQRLCARTPETYCTARRRARNPHRRDQLVQNAMNSVVRNRRVISGQSGHIRIRYTPTVPEPTVELRRGAFRACA